MNSYLLLRLLHFAGIIFLGGGLLAVFVSEWRSYSAKEPAAFVEAAYYTTIFYDALVTSWSHHAVGERPIPDLAARSWVVRSPLAGGDVGTVSVRVH